MRKYYDKLNNRLVFVGKVSGDVYWDKHWQTGDFESLLKVKNNRFITVNTRRYLLRGARILEGGCGRGDKVHILFSQGYDAYGVEYAKDTVEKIKSYAPYLKVSVGDVRRLQFEDGFFDGYWSLGVIEHFYDGYEPFLLEARRILKKGGYLFVTVPVISWLRRQKLKRAEYPEYNESEDMKKNFFQFVIDFRDIVKQFQAFDFKLVRFEPIGGVKGLKDEIPLFKPLLQLIYDSNTFFAKVARRVIDILVRPFANHMGFFIFKKL